MKIHLYSTSCPFFVVACLSIVGACLATRSVDAVELHYDLDWNGPDTSYAEECLHDGSCFRYPIEGTIGIRLESNQPHLFNVDSTLITPPGAPPNPIAEFAWQRLEWTIGQYLGDPSTPEVSMQFYPNPILDTAFPLYQLFVDLSDGRTRLTLTGGEDPLFLPPQDPASVAFVVSGRLVPEPGTLAVAATAVAALIANRRRR